MDKEFEKILEDILEENSEVLKRLRVAGLHVELQTYVMHHWRDYFAAEPFEGLDAVTAEEVADLLSKDKAFLQYKQNERLLEEVGVKHAGDYILHRLRNHFHPTPFRF